MSRSPPRRVTVVLHDRPQSQGLLELGVDIARQLEAELEGVFVEDAALFRLTGLPFLREVKRDSFTEERLDPQRLLQEWRAMAKLSREALESTATRAGLNWSFRVWRGEFDSDLQQLALESQMLLLGRLTTPPRRLSETRGGARTRPLKLGVILDNDAAADQLLQAVGELSLKPEIQLILFLLPDGMSETEAAIEQRLKAIDPQHQNVLVRLADREPATLGTSLKAATCDLLMVSAASELLRGRNMRQRLSNLPYPVVVVR
jgi:hypothetical protein